VRVFVQAFYPVRTNFTLAIFTKMAYNIFIVGFFVFWNFTLNRRENHVLEKMCFISSLKTLNGVESHRIRFVFTPKHCSWLNQIEIWFCGLSRRVLNRGNFRSVNELKAKIQESIAFGNLSAKPMKWKMEI